MQTVLLKLPMFRLDCLTTVEILLGGQFAEMSIVTVEGVEDGLNPNHINFKTDEMTGQRFEEKLYQIPVIHPRYKL